ncbi:MAG: hypothetical protein ACFFG0_03880 [Candidatus Thorarchaeota archaeon]
MNKKDCKGCKIYGICCWTVYDNSCPCQNCLVKPICSKHITCIQRIGWRYEIIKKLQGELK